MATVSNYDPNNPDGTQNSPQSGQQTSGQGSQSNAPQTGSQSVYTTSGGGSGQGTAASSNASPAPTKSGQFTNLNAYLNANKSFNQGNQDPANNGLAGSINQNFQNQANDINNNVATDQNNFNTAANTARSGYTNYSGQAATPSSQAQTANSNPAGYQDFLNSVTSDPTAAVGNQQTLAQWNNAMNANYTGPTQLDPTQQLNQQAQNYQQQAQQAQTENGRFGLLGQMFYNPGYNQGQQSLDNLFLQSNPSQIATLQGTQTQANQLNNNINQANNQATNAAQSYGQEAQNIAGQAKSAIGGQTGDANAASGFTGSGAIGNFLSGLNNDISSAQTNDTQTYKNLVNDFNSGKLNSTEMQEAGITPDILKNSSLSGAIGQLQQSSPFYAAQNINQLLSNIGINPNGNYTYNTGLANSVGADTNTFNANTVANGQQAAQYAALSQLAGISPTAISKSIDPNAASTASTYDLSKLINNQLGNQLQKNQAGSQPQIEQLLAQLVSANVDPSAGVNQTNVLQQLQGILGTNMAPTAQMGPGGGHSL